MTVALTKHRDHGIPESSGFNPVYRFLDVKSMRIHLIGMNFREEKSRYSGD
jgi:hypothetical protein